MTNTAQNGDLTQLINVLSACAENCRAIASSSDLEEARAHKLPDLDKLVRLVNDSAACCDIAILLIERKSHIVIDFLQVCEERLLTCAWECTKYGYDSFRICGLSCERVAQACLPFIIQSETV